MAYTFNGSTKLIVLSTGTVGLDLIDLWSRWKDWVLSGNASDERAFNYAGGEDIDSSEGTKVPLFLFLLNGWRIRPQEADHTLRVFNGTLIVSGGGDPFVDTVGAYTVRVRYSQPVQAIGYTSGGGGGGATAAQVWEYGTRTLTQTVPTAPENADELLHNAIV